LIAINYEQQLPVKTFGMQKGIGQQQQQQQQKTEKTKEQIKASLLLKSFVLRSLSSLQLVTGNWQLQLLLRCVVINV